MAKDPKKTSGSVKKFGLALLATTALVGFTAPTAQAGAGSNAVKDIGDVLIDSIETNVERGIREGVLGQECDVRTNRNGTRYRVGDRSGEARRDSSNLDCRTLSVVEKQRRAEQAQRSNQQEELRAIRHDTQLIQAMERRRAAEERYFGTQQQPVSATYNQRSAPATVAPKKLPPMDYTACLRTHADKGSFTEVKTYCDGRRP